MEYLHYFLIVLIVLSSLFVFLSENPVHSVLFLILSFCNACSILVIFYSEFLGFLFIIIYVGAIAVLFLFVVMMLNVKIYKQKINYFYYMFFILLLVISSQIIFFNVNNIFFYSFSFLEKQNILNFNYLIDSLSNIDTFGQTLYNYFIICFLLAGLLLLIAMIGSIVLTLNFYSQRRNELTYKQLSRSNRFLSFFF